MIKIVRIIARLNIGGPARNAVLLSEGFRNTVLVCGEVDRSEGDMMYLAREKCIEPVIVPELGRELSWKDDWSAFWKIYKIIRQEKPDIIHTHTAKAGTLGRVAGIVYNYGKGLLRPFGARNDKRNWARNDDKGLARNGKAKLIHTFHGHIFEGYFNSFLTRIFIFIEKTLA